MSSLYAVYGKKKGSAAIQQADVKANARVPSDPRINTAGLLEEVKDIFPDVLPLDAMEYFAKERTNGEFAPALRYSLRRETGEQESVQTTFAGKKEALPLRQVNKPLSIRPKRLAVQLQFVVYAMRSQKSTHPSRKILGKLKNSARGKKALPAGLEHPS